MQRIYNLDRWRRLDEGQYIEFSNPAARLVRIEVNAPRETGLYVETPDGEVRFLALVRGRDTVEFSAPGAFRLGADDPDVLILTADGADVSVPSEVSESFTRVVERRKRNPELEAVMATMMLNVERRFAQQEEERRELEQRLSRSEAARAPEPPPASVSDAAAGQGGQGDAGAREAASGAGDGGGAGATAAGGTGDVSRGPAPPGG